MILPPACAAVQRSHEEPAGRSLHCGGLPTAACEGGTRQSNAARVQGVAPLPLMPTPDSPLGWPGKDGKGCEKRRKDLGRGRKVAISSIVMW